MNNQSNTCQAVPLGLLSPSLPFGFSQRRNNQSSTCQAVPKGLSSPSLPFGFSQRQPKFIFLIALVLIFGSCKKNDDAKSSEKAILSFATGDKVWCSGNCGSVISASFPKGVSTLLTPTIVVSAGADIQPPSGVAKDFSAEVVYTVTAADGSTARYTVKAN
jgi:hypothetical protein